MIDHVIVPIPDSHQKDAIKFVELIIAVNKHRREVHIKFSEPMPRWLERVFAKIRLSQQHDFSILDVILNEMSLGATLHFSDICNDSFITWFKMKYL